MILMRASLRLAVILASVVFPNQLLPENKTCPRQVEDVELLCIAVLSIDLI
jgi:hypothetical protein